MTRDPYYTICGIATAVGSFCIAAYAMGRLLLGDLVNGWIAAGLSLCYLTLARYFWSRR